MIHAFVYLLIGSAISYFMQSRIVTMASAITSTKWLQTGLKILFDAILSVTWLVTLPLYFIITTYLKSSIDEEKTKR